MTDNKIFIIVSDHGMTAMPTNLKYKDKNWLGMEVERPAEMSCRLKLDFVDPDNPNAVTREQLAELNNNNLHIWELAEVLKSVGENGWEQYRVLAPKEIAELYKKIDKKTKKVIELPYGAAEKTEKVDIIAALNGPMAHIYLTDKGNLGKVAELFRLACQDYYPEEALKWWDMDELDYLDFRANTVRRMKSSIDGILVRIGGNYCVFDGLNDDGSPKCASNDPFSADQYVRAWERVMGMNHPDRSGDIVVLMRMNMSDINQRYSAGSSCRAWHGSLNRSDSHVPFIFAYPGGNKAEVEKILGRETLCKMDFSSCWGNWRVSDLIKVIILEQYKEEITR